MRIVLFTRDIIITIVGFLADNKDTCSMVKSCHPIKNILYNYGYLKRMDIYHKNLFQAVKQYDKHKKTMVSLTLHNIENIQYYFSWFPRHLTLNFCTFDILTNQSTNTTELVINDYYDCKDPKKIKLQNFPKLQKINTLYTVIQYV